MEKTRRELQYYPSTNTANTSDHDSRFLTNRHGIKGGDYLWAGQSLQSVLQGFKVDTFFRVVRRVHQHGQAVLHGRQLGGDDCKVLGPKRELE